jgi:hypothetical protein
MLLELVDDGFVRVVTDGFLLLLSVLFGGFIKYKFVEYIFMYISIIYDGPLGV